MSEDKNRFDAEKSIANTIGLQHPEDVKVDLGKDALRGLYIELCPKTHNRPQGEVRGTYSGVLANAQKRCSRCPFFGGVAFKKDEPQAVVCLHPVYRPIRRVET